VIRFAWLQFRMQAVLAASVISIMAVVVALTGPNLVHLFDTTVANCAADHSCSTALTAFTDTDGPLQITLDFLLLVTPLLIGMFWGAPLVSREFEAGTFRLAWTQGVTRTRWLAVKLGLGVVVSALIAGAFSLMVTWWSSRLDQVNAAPFDSLRFGVRDVVPIGYAVFAFVLGLCAGMIFRRLLPAMLTTLIGFVAIREIISAWVRPHLLATSHVVLPITTATPVSIDQTSPGVISAYESVRGIKIPDAWVYSVKIADTAGQPPTTAFLKRACPLGNFGPLNPGACSARIAAKFHQFVTYQPSSHYWPLQWYELAIFLALSVVMGSFCFWWICRPVN
jgi:ABC-type transport system involved in multi-copper enzyme maturation permease subunit